MADREPGELVREKWLEWARRQPDPKLSWLMPWKDLGEGQREVDAEIEAAVRDDERERFRRFARAFADGSDETTMAALYDEAMATGARAQRERFRRELAGDQTADHAPIESDHGLACRTCVTWLEAPGDPEGAHEFGIAIPEQWPCRVARVLAGEA